MGKSLKPHKGSVGLSAYHILAAFNALRCKYTKSLGLIVFLRKKYCLPPEIPIKRTHNRQNTEKIEEKVH
jgi:hypothetical protein